MTSQKPEEIFNIRNPEQLLHIVQERKYQGEDVLVAIARIYGLRVEYIPLDLESSGKLSFHPGLDQWVVTINSLHHPRRQRFTFAHELAHFFLHRKEKFEFSDAVFFRAENVKSHMETEANNFAGALLMPKEEFVYYVRNTSKQIEDIAKEFNVSAMAVKVRADVIKGNTYEY
ncbi:ImmA/IrrE family metallo-endopeptidase [Photobacterium ganghwense]|uniref:ImmA/IrrE family metallo-endopeptidase n=1 Tax=Photobacterium ganghwense TaxID=320778 RepID=UPI0039F1148E